MRKSLLVLAFAVPGFAPAWASHEASGLAVPPGPGFRGGVVAVSHPLAAEAGADTRLFTNPDGSNQGFTPASTSGQAVGVPGTLKVVATAVQRFGRMRLAEVIQPAIELAEKGFPVNFVLAGDAQSARTSYYAETAAVFRPGGVPLQQGQILRQPDLAKTLRLIAAKGPDALYRGEIGAAIVAAQRATANGGKPGLMTMQDLADYHIVLREPIVGEC